MLEVGCEFDDQSLGGVGSVMFKCKPKKILEQDPAVTAFVRVFPSRRVLRPIFKGFLQMKLNGVDKLVV